MNFYLVPEVAYRVYSYIGWVELSNDKYVPDYIWKRMCEDYCEDETFKIKFNAYWMMDNSVFSYRERLLLYINSVVRYKKNTIEGSDITKCNVPKILLNNKDFVRTWSSYNPHYMVTGSFSVWGDHVLLLVQIQSQSHGLTGHQIIHIL